MEQRMATEMTSRERVLAALAGNDLDRPPVSLWRHFPDADQSARQLADSTLAWQAALKFDFIKLMPPGDYATIDWGATSEYQGAAGGTRQTTRYPVQRPEDWDTIGLLDVARGFNAEVVGACRHVRDQLGPEAPILQTIFSPLTIAYKLSEGLVIKHMRDDPERVHQALENITAVTRAMARASLAAGADGVFFASQCATSELVTRAHYDEFGTAYDEPVLAAVNDAGSIFTLMHIHGDNAYFDVLASYDAHALNWHDRRFGPPIADVLRDYPNRAAVAGIDEHGIVEMSAGDVEDQVRDARASANDRHLLIGPGCVITVATPGENLQAAVAAAKLVN
jgi:uroporphyrinogen decarboxylase